MKIIQTILFVCLATIILLGLPGCELNPQIEDTYNHKDNRYFIHGGQIYAGNEVSLPFELETGKKYNIVIWGTNDGDSDSLTVFAMENEVRTTIGTYTTLEQRWGGNGWWNEFPSPTFTFVPQQGSVIIGVHVNRADDYGTWPKAIEITEAP